jgi:hypothetical protein
VAILEPFFSSFEGKVHNFLQSLGALFLGIDSTMFYLIESFRVFICVLMQLAQEKD